MTGLYERPSVDHPAVWALLDGPAEDLGGTGSLNVIQDSAVLRVHPRHVSRARSVSATSG